MKQLKKIAVGTVAKGAFSKFYDGDLVGTERVIMTVYGRADKFQDRATNSPSGDAIKYTKFRGDFIAYAGEFEEGEKFRAPVLILPAAAGTELRELLASEEAPSANFGFVISARKVAGPSGFEFAVTQLVSKAAEADPLEPVARMVAEALPAKASARKAKGDASGKTSSGKATAAAAK